jgi:hypothetical protein
VQDNVDVADCYGCELMRLYDHYRFRFRLRGLKEEGKAVKPLMLTPDDRWTIDYFTPGTLKMSDRHRFAGETS